MGSDAHDLQKDLKIYKAVYIGLLVLTVITVAVNFIHLSQWHIALPIIVALLIAIYKASLVAGYFMHLKTEKKLIIWIVIFALFLFVSLILLLIGGQYSLFEGAYYVP
jgi:cytochrome c oxidase subunit 4